MNGQIVLCQGCERRGGTGADDPRSDADYLPLLKSVSVVPVGLTKYRDGLYPLEPFTKEDAGKVLDLDSQLAGKAVTRNMELHFIHAGDEWYILAERSLCRRNERYDGYLQLENGVGMLRLLINEFEVAFAALWQEIFAEPEMTADTRGTVHCHGRAGCTRISADRV